MTATYDLTSGVYSVPSDGLNKFFVMKNVVSFVDNPMTASQTMALFDIPANVLVLEVGANVTTADTGATSFNLGIYGGTTDGFIDGLSMASATWVRDTSGETYTLPAGYISTSDAQVIITADGVTIDGSVVEFFALCVDLN